MEFFYYFCCKRYNSLVRNLLYPLINRAISYFEINFSNLFQIPFIKERRFVYNKSEPTFLLYLRGNQGV